MFIGGLDLIPGASYECLEVGFADDPYAMPTRYKSLGLSVL